eukprot:3383243-Alexandrium_andersonii.AAC.1
MLQSCMPSLHQCRCRECRGGPCCSFVAAWTCAQARRAGHEMHAVHCKLRATGLMPKPAVRCTPSLLSVAKPET